MSGCLVRYVDKMLGDIKFGFVGLFINGLFFMILMYGSKLVNEWIVVDFLVLRLFIIMMSSIFGLMMFISVVNFIFFWLMIV